MVVSKITGATGPLVQHFIDLFNFSEFKTAFESQLIPANNGCIESLLNSNQPELFHYIKSLIQFQLQHFRRMIPGDFHAIISDALNEKVFIKLLGSGGGGFLLAIAETEDILKVWAEKQGIQTLIATNNEQLT